MKNLMRLTLTSLLVLFSLTVMQSLAGDTSASAGSSPLPQPSTSPTPPACDSDDIYKFTGVLRNENDYCQSAVAGIEIKVYEADGLFTNPALSICGCGDNPATEFGVDSGGIPTVKAHNVAPWCFKGRQKKYDLKYTIGGNTFMYRWIAEDTVPVQGFYSLMDFGGTPNDNVDDTFALKSAAAYIGSRITDSGGTLYIPNGYFKLGTSSAEQSELPVILPPGIIVQGASAKPYYSSSRVQIESSNQTIFKIKECSDQIAIRNLNIVSLSTTGTRAIHAFGDRTDHPTKGIVFSNLSIHGFSIGIHVEGADEHKSWQFDLVKLENSEILGCNVCVLQDTQNSEWIINNTSLGIRQDGVGLQIERVGMMTIQGLIGGGAPINAGPTVTYPSADAAKAFIWIRGQHATINIQNSASENTRHAILYDYDSSTPLTSTTDVFDHSFVSPLMLQNCSFGDTILFRSNAMFVSTGNLYYANTVRTERAAGYESMTIDGFYSGDDLRRHHSGSSKTKIFSIGDQFGYRNNSNRDCPPVTLGFGTATDASVTCVRDFILDNSVVSGVAGQNAVVMRSNKDGSSFQGPLRINGPQNQTPNNAPDSLWGYTVQRNNATKLLDFTGNEAHRGYSFDGVVQPSTNGVLDLGTEDKRWKDVYADNIIHGDAILFDKKTGKMLYRIREDENNVYFEDIRTGKEMMRLDRNGNLFVPGRVVQNAGKPRTRLRRNVRKNRRRKA